MSDDPKLHEVHDWNEVKLAKLGPEKVAEIQEKAKEEVKELTETISYEDFTKVKLKVGTIQAAVRVPKTDKLLQLTVDLGEAVPRTIVAGIGSTFEPEDLINTQVVVVANLAPRKIRGIESHGMLLAVGPSPDKLCLIRPTQSWIRDHSTSNGIAPGSDVG